MNRIVIFMTNISFMKHHIQDMYVREISKVYITELWDLSCLYGSKDNDTSIEGVKMINSEDELNEKLSYYSGLGEVIVITNILNINLNRIYSIIKKYRIPIVNINKDSLAGSLEERGSLRFIKYYRLKAQLYTIARRIPIIKSIIRKKLFGNLPYDYLLGGANYYPFQTKKFMRIHQIKYDEFLRAKTSERIIKDRYILYVGSAPSSHPGYIGRSNSLNHENYVKSICSYLDTVENETGCKIVISGHPKGRYIKKEWGNREIYFGNTAELIHHCEAVICHFSTSLINCVLEYKPFQIAYDSTILTSAFRGSMIMGMELGRICDADICDMTNPHKWTMTVNRLAYDKFLDAEIINKDYKDKTDEELILMYIASIFENWDGI